MTDDRPPRLAWRMWKRFLLAAFLIVLLSAGATATAGLLEVNDVVKAIREGKPIELGHELTPAEAGKPQTILVLGSDQRYADKKLKNPGRSDTMILVRLDPNKDATSVLSIPRDLKVLIPGHGIDKINAAYANGGPRLTLMTIKALLGIKINHVVNVDFGGFRRAVNYVGCVYADIDRRYFNDNSGFGPDYAAIDIQAGYQKLCGQDSLDYVRYRHEDTDLVRSARQQDFLRQAKDQIGVKKIVSDRKALARIFGRYTQTDKDLRSNKAVLRLLKLVIFSAGHPIREVHFQGDLGESFVTASPEQIAATVNEFLSGKSSKGPRGTLKSSAAERTAARKQKKRRPASIAGLENAATAAESLAIPIATRAHFSVYYPKLGTTGAVYAQDSGRTYSIRDAKGRRYRAYRMVIKKGLVGEYYGVQGMTWRDPPILDDPSETRTVGKRKLLLYFDGSRLRLVAWKTPHGVYWISNTLLESLSEKQMVAIARSLTRVGK